MGGTITISNLGRTVVDSFSAIVNPPSAVILAVARTKKTWVHDETAEENHHGRWADMMNVTLSCDHRVIDGAVAADWCASFKKYIENPFGLLI
jgi:pyruvate dehydrogenase E2 component (dihydrolipoamide acetyltransferase)